MLGITERVIAKKCDSIYRHLSRSAVVKAKSLNKKLVTEKEVYQFFNKPERLPALFYPQNLFVKKRNNMPDNFYIADKLAANKILKELKKNLPDDKLLMEVNPGVGLLTQMLIDETKNDLYLYENEEKLFYRIANIMEKYQDRRISLKQCDFIALWKMGYLDKLDDGNRVEEIFHNVTRKEYADDTVARLFACVGSPKFFKDLVNSVIFQNGFLSAGRIEMFLCVPPPTFITIASSPLAGYFLYRPISVLFQILFEYEFLTKINKKLFLPWKTEPTKAPKMGKILKIDSDYMYLIRVTPRADLFKYCQPENLSALWFFVKQHLMSRKKAVIPTMERWIPGCGPRLIVNSKPSREPDVLFPKNVKDDLPDFLAPSTTLVTNNFVKNIHIFTQFGMLTPTQILSVFNEFIHWPEYENCAFVDVLEKALIKMHTKPDEVDDDDELSDDENEEKKEK